MNDTPIHNEDRMIYSLFLAFFSVFFVSCQSSYSPSPPLEISSPIEVFFCPLDDCEQALIQVINSTRQTIHCAFFDVDLPLVIDALKKKSSSADVKLVVDGDNVHAGLKPLSFVADDKQ